MDLFIFFAVQMRVVKHCKIKRPFVLLTFMSNYFILNVLYRIFSTEYLVRDIWFRIFGLGYLVWDICFGIFVSEYLVRDV